jgi:hypothetical protein
MEKPAACLAHIFTWLGLPACAVDLQQLAVGIQESDSHYHMKYLPILRIDQVTAGSVPRATGV